MLQTFAPWTQTLSGYCSDKLEYLKPQIGSKYYAAIGPIRPGIFLCVDGTPHQGPKIRKHEVPWNVDFPPILPKDKKKPYPIPIKKIKEAARTDKKLAQTGIEKPLDPPTTPHQARWIKKHEIPQNVDFPPVQPKDKKKPYPIPIKKIKEAARADKRLAQMGIEKPLYPPKNGLLVPDLVPVAYEVLDNWKILIKGVTQLLHVVPVHACSECSEVHIAERVHEFQDCRGPTSNKRRSFHSWVKGSINDIILPIESYHMYDPFGKRIKHETRFSFDRVPAIVELCIQAGVDLPAYPSRRRTEPIRMIGRKIIDIGGYVEEPGPRHSVDTGSSVVDIDTHRAFERFPPPEESEVAMIAQETIEAYDRVKWGLKKLMRMYTVKACGYCTEIHVGPWGHKVKVCGAFKHQWRDGKHGWQDATVDEVFPPNYVWHIPDPKGQPLKSELKRFYGKAPAVIELCVQAGAKIIPDIYKPMMRLDIVLPETEEADLVI